MKCVKKGEEVQNVTDAKAEKLVKNAGYNYCPRSEWKAIRDAEIKRKKDSQKKKEQSIEAEQLSAVISPKSKNKK
jgi:hypothetical protein